MSLDGLSNNRPINLSAKTEGADKAKAANKVSGNGGESAVGGVNPKVSEAASLAGNGKSAAAGQALLMMQGNNTLPNNNGFLTGKASPPEIGLARQAIIPLEGADAKLGELLRYAFSFSDTLPTAEDSIKLFKESGY
jgi:hypothetical protein